jgi:hypothetical protein
MHRLGAFSELKARTLLAQWLDVRQPSRGVTPMRLSHLSRRGLLAAACAATVFSGAAFAQTPVKFQLDWRFEGPAALFLASTAKA